MKIRNQLLSLAGLFAVASSAQATLINFQGLADSTVGESAWTSYSTAAFGADIDITANPSGAHVYFDSGVAGLGVCSTGLNGTNTVDTTNAFSTSNMCNTSSDDNIDVGTEALVFNFNETASFDSIWLNNNHDAGDLTGKTVLFSLNGGTATSYTISASELIAPGTLGYRIDFGAAGTTGISNFFSAGDTLSVAYDDSYGSNTAQQFYVSAIEVPEPAIVALLGLGLVGIGFARRMRK